MKTSTHQKRSRAAATAKSLRLKRVVGRVVLVIAIWAIGHWMGYWYGRTKELYESGKRYGVIAADVTWEQWLKHK